MKKLLLITLVATPVIANSADWKIISYSGIDSYDEKTTSIDKGSIVKEGAYKKAWVREAYTNVIEFDKTIKYNSGKTLFYFDCNKKTAYITNVIYYLDDKRTFFTNRKLDKHDFIDIAPETTGEDMLNFVCQYNE